MAERDGPLDRGLIPRERLDALIEALGEEIGGARPMGGIAHEGHGNDLFELHFDDGRVLMVKRARVAAARPSFETACEAARLLRSAEDLVAPRHLPVPAELFELPVLVYWRIALPTLREVWPTLRPEGQLAAMHSWGALAARLHRLRFPGHGSLLDATRQPTPLAAHLEEELSGFLRETFTREWADGLAALALLEDAVPVVAPRAGRTGGTLLHNDLYMPNILCERRGETVCCVGVLDLEAARIGPPEADMARPLVLYGPLFGDLPQPLLDGLLEGYGAPLDRPALGFYRAWHLLNIGIHCARRGLYEFAAIVAHAAQEEAEALLRHPASRVA